MTPQLPILLLVPWPRLLLLQQLRYLILRCPKPARHFSGTFKILQLTSLTKSFEYHSQPTLSVETMPLL